MRNNTNTFKNLLAALLTIAALATGHTTAWAQSTENLGGYDFTVVTDGNDSYYIVDCKEALNALATYVNGTDNVSIGKTFRQTANIDMSSVNNFDPIGSIGGSKSFKGTYDGGNFTISNLTVSNNYGAIGLFGMIKDATIRNIVLVSPTVGAVNPGGNEVCLGALIGVCDKISGTNTVDNCHVISPTLTVSGTSSGTNNIGAIIGEIYNKTTVTNCYYYSNATEYAAIGKYDSDATLTNVARVYQLTLNNCTAATADLTVGSVNYCKEGTEVTLTITPAEGYSIGTVKYNDGSDHVITPTNDVYSFTMPASNVTVSATFTVTTSYVDANGTLHENVLAIPLDGSEPADEHDCVLLSAGTYYVGNTNPDGVDASYTCLVFNGPATLILGDGATMSVNQTVSNAEALFVGANAPLTIYGQTLGTGTLTVTNNGGLSGIRSSSDITINGGIIETTGSYGIHSYSNITLNGGTITATGIMAEGTSTRITLGGATVTSNSYSADIITIVDGMGYVDDTGAVYYGTLWSEAKAAIANKTLTKDMSWTNLKAAFEAGGTQTVTLTNNVIRINSDHIEPTGTVTLDLNGYTIDGGSSQTNPILRVRNGVNLTITDSRTGGNLCKAGINPTVSVSEGGSLTLAAGTINGSSWGVYVNGSFTMTGGTITAATISGVDLNGNGSFTMTGGSITANAVGVDVSSATATFTVSGNVDITGNTTKDVNMYYDDQSSTLNPIHIGGTLASTARIGIYTDCSVGDSEAKAFTVGLKGRGTRENFNLKTSQAIVLVNLEDGEMAVAKPYTLSVPNNVAVNELTEASSNTYTVGYGDHITLTYVGEVGSWPKSAHYTVPNGTITYLGNVDAQGRKIAFTMPNANTTITKDSDKDYIFNGITLKETFSGNASQGLDAIFDGTSVVIVDIPNDIEVKSVTYDREFKGQTPATVMLPFDYTCNGNEGGKFYTFVGVEYDDNNDQWVATMEEEYDPKNRVTCLERNKPYLFMPNGSEGAPANMQFPYIPGYVTLNTTGGSNGVHDAGPWKFHGVYHKKVWADPSNDYGFAATSGRSADDTQDITAGDFVRFAPGAWMKPMRCYLSFVGTNNARGMNRAAETEELPQRITVRLVSANGDATDIGTIDTRTGEFIPNGWYDMNGRKLNGKPAVPGIYVNNGKKIVIK